MYPDGAAAATASASRTATPKSVRSPSSPSGSHNRFAGSTSQCNTPVPKQTLPRVRRVPRSLLPRECPFSRSAQRPPRDAPKGGRHPRTAASRTPAPNFGRRTAARPGRMPRFDRPLAAVALQPRRHGLEGHELPQVQVLGQPHVAVRPAPHPADHPEPLGDRRQRGAVGRVGLRHPAAAGPRGVPGGPPGGGRVVRRRVAGRGPGPGAVRGPQDRVDAAGGRPPRAGACSAAARGPAAGRGAAPERRCRCTAGGGPGVPTTWSCGTSLGGRSADRLQGGPLPWQEAARYAADAGEGLLEVHARGVLHWDVKPANLLWDPEGDEGLLTDFGVAVRLAEAVAAAGTPGYPRPEAWVGRASAASDVYGLAATLFHLAAGERPFPGLGAAELKSQIAAGLPESDPAAVWGAGAAGAGDPCRAGRPTRTAVRARRVPRRLAGHAQPAPGRHPRPPGQRGPRGGPAAQPPPPGEPAHRGWPLRAGGGDPTRTPARRPAT